MKTIYKYYLQGLFLNNRAQVPVVCKESPGVDSIYAQIRERENTWWIIVSCGNSCDEQ